MNSGRPVAAGGSMGAGSQCDAMLLGREPVDGGVHAASLAALVRGLAGTKARPNRQGRRFLLRCSESGVELVLRRPALHRPGRGIDDEGFESDDDRRSTRSDDSNSISSSCCLVEDHVFKAAAISAAPAAVSSTSSDSANSSGGSDTDEVDTASAPVGKSLEVVPVEAVMAAGASTTVPVRETFSFQDVAFCHVDAAFPRVVVLVVRRAAGPRRLRAGREPVGLEALVLECRSEETLRALCSSYQELSRRSRLDGQYRAPHRRKDLLSPESLDPGGESTTSTVGATSKSHLSTQSAAGCAPPLPKFIFSKVDEIALESRGGNGSTSSGSGPASIASTRDSSEVGSSTTSRYNLVHRTDGDGVTHIEVSRGGSSVVNVEDAANSDMCGPSSIISISTPDAGNILLLGGGAPSTAKDRPSRISKEIEGVIRADVDSISSLGRMREAGFRQRQQPDVIESSGGGGKLWTSALDDEPSSGPASLPVPQRPERKRFVRKSKAPAPPAPQHHLHHQADGAANLAKKQQQDGGSNTLGREQRVVRGQFIRVSVDQTPPQPPLTPQMPTQPVGWVSHFPAGWTGPPPARSATPHPAAPSWRRDLCQDIDQRQRYHQRRSRSSDSGRGQQLQRPRSPIPVTRRPMAYRYIDTPSAAAAAAALVQRPHPPPSATTNSLSNRFFGLSQKLREIGGSVVGVGYPGSGRRNSWGDSPTRFYTSLECPAGGKMACNNLKSVIKKNHAAGAEPKKVTFSAYATVQVVD